ncbi:MAG: hypothetical protein ACOCUU_02365 [Nanoarchaeota archaeon]
MISKKEMNKKAQAMQNQTLYLIIAVVILAIAGYFVWSFYQGTESTSEYLPKDLEIAVQTCKNTALLDSSISYCQYRKMELTEGGEVYANCNFVYEVADKTVEEKTFEKKDAGVCKKEAIGQCMDLAEKNFANFRPDKIKVANKDGTEVNTCEELITNKDKLKAYCEDNEGKFVVYYAQDEEGKQGELNKSQCTTDDSETKIKDVEWSKVYTKE